ncbi:MAG TPA: type I-E CRISPR-associated protein Cas6/Cse3/CasE [Alphaproteobacteria bacterium]|nr:type I-E CRISPR-associated protein Cas6/Cse3/CasE [Alphaproteobacteria bacterium]
MMYLTRARLAQGPGQSGAIAAQLAEASGRDLGHALIWSLMSKDGPGRDFIYRQTDVSPPSYLILSQRKPEDAHRLWKLETKSFAPGLAIGARFSFSLRVSPSIRKGRGAVPTEKGEPVANKQVDVVMDAKLRAKREGRKFDYDEDVPLVASDWLAARAERRGFSFQRQTLRVSGYRQIELAAANKKDQSPSRRESGKHDKRFSVLDFDGVLTVTDPALFAKALTEGIGGKRSYGCGLLLIRPV